MTTRTETVHRGSDGSVHYLASNLEASFLLITDPVAVCALQASTDALRLVHGQLPVGS
jgi:hypothetical protein